MNVFLMFNDSLYSFKFGAPISVSDTIKFNVDALAFAPQLIIRTA